MQICRTEDRYLSSSYARRAIRRGCRTQQLISKRGSFKLSCWIIKARVPLFFSTKKRASVAKTCSLSCHGKARGSRWGQFAGVNCTKQDWPALRQSVCLVQRWFPLLCVRKSQAWKINLNICSVSHLSRFPCHSEHLPWVMPSSAVGKAAEHTHNTAQSSRLNNTSSGSSTQHLQLLQQPPCHADSTSSYSNTLKYVADQVSENHTVQFIYQCRPEDTGQINSLKQGDKYFPLHSLQSGRRLLDFIRPL